MGSTKCNLKIIIIWNDAPNTVRVTFSAGGKQVILTKTAPIKTLTGYDYNILLNWTAKVNNKNWKVPATGKIRMKRKVETLAFVLRK